MKWVNPFEPSVAFHIETSHLFCSAKQMIGFCMKSNIGAKWINKLNQFKIGKLTICKWCRFFAFLANCERISLILVLL